MTSACRQAASRAGHFQIVKTIFAFSLSYDSLKTSSPVEEHHTKVVDIGTSGAGKIDAHKLRASRAIVDSKGVSRVEVYATEELNVTVSGPSHVIYEGNPTINKTVHGPGSVEKRESSPA